eukprot:1959030-Rhodomonas_salina.6
MPPAPLPQTPFPASLAADLWGRTGGASGAASTLLGLMTGKRSCQRPARCQSAARGSMPAWIE